MKRNLGVDLLKTFACIGVVSLHFGDGLSLCAASVPVFMFLSLFLSGKVIQDGSGIVNRIVRLYRPFCIWGLIYFVILSIHGRNFDVGNLMLQLTIGVPACPPLYFIFLLILNTVVIWAIMKLPRNIACGTMLLVVIVCLLLQYSGVNVKIFANLPFYVKYDLGRFVELLPSAICGFLCWQYRARWIMTVALLPAVLQYAIGWHGNCPGYSYQGVYLLFITIGVSSLCIGFGERLSCKVSDKIADGVAFVGGLTPGVYYVHLLVGKVLEVALGRHRGIEMTVAVTLMSACIVFCLRRIKYCKVLVR